MQGEQDFLEVLRNLHFHHMENQSLYAEFVSRYFLDQEIQSIENLPFLPVRFFKYFDLKSVPQEEVYKTIYSSGTSGMPSRISLDKKTAAMQSRILAELAMPLLGNKRVPMVVFDRPCTVAKRNNFAARAAGINGFRFLAKKIIFVLNDRGEISETLLDELEECRGDSFFLYGFTSEVWRIIERFTLEDKIRKFFSSSTLIHGGGWKKMATKGISKDHFIGQVRSSLGVTNVIDYYGMVEQVGSIFFECPFGYFHDTAFARVLIRNPYDFSLAVPGDSGLIQCLSVIPFSYPGHSILTEDLGVRAVESCACGSEFPGFLVQGRATAAEKRGCSDAVD